MDEDRDEKSITWVITMIMLTIAGFSQAETFKLTAKSKVDVRPDRIRSAFYPPTFGREEDVVELYSTLSIIHKHP